MGFRQVQTRPFSPRWILNIPVDFSGSFDSMFSIELLNPKISIDSSINRIIALLQDMSHCDLNTACNLITSHFKVILARIIKPFVRNDLYILEYTVILSNK